MRAFIQFLLRAWGAAFVAAVLLAATGQSAAMEALGPVGLRARHASLSAQLRTNAFGAPLYIESVETSSSAQGDLYAVVAHPFGKFSTTLTQPAHWCDVLILHLNTKYCRQRGEGSVTRLDVRVGRKYDQPLSEATLLAFTWRPLAAGPEYMDVELGAPNGPFGTRDYRMLVEAVPLDAEHTFMHLGYAFGFGPMANLAIRGYLATIGHDKVGFSTTTASRPGEPPAYVGGTRGLVERNAMRYYLAIDAYLDAPGPDQLERRLQAWFAASENYPLQLHEIERSSYLSMKRAEYKRQQEP